MVFTEYVKIREEKFGSVIFETLKERVFITNETGKDILNLIEKGYSQEKITEILAGDYGVFAQDVKEDIANFISQLTDNKIISL